MSICGANVDKTEAEIVNLLKNIFNFNNISRETLNVIFL